MDDLSPHENRLDKLTAQVQLLTTRMDELSRRVDALSTHVRAGPTPWPDGDRHPIGVASPTGFNPAVFLSNLAIVCFLLVIALVLRTIVDNGIIQQHLGSLIGIGYAGLLMALGYYRYATTRRRAPVYVICGAVLLFSILFETHARFAVFSAEFAYAMLGFTMIAMTALGMRLGAYTPICVGILGASAVGILLQFPNSTFLYLAALLFLGCAAAFVVSQAPSCRWLPWSEFGLLLFFWLTWSIKLRQSLLVDSAVPPHLAQAWFLPTVAVFAVAYVLMALWGPFNSEWKMGWFETALPSLNAAWAYAAARSITLPVYKDGFSLGLWGVAGAALLLVLAAIIDLRGVKSVRASSAFVAAGLLLLAAALPAMLESTLAVLLTWSTVTLIVGVAATYRRNRPTRLLTFIFQIYIVLVAVGSGALMTTQSQHYSRIAAALALAGMGLLHLFMRPNWVRHPATGRWQLLDATERFDVVLLVAATLYSLMAARLLLFVVLAALGLESGHVFQCGQSILINVFALLLMGIGIAFTSFELLVLAAVLAAAGAGKVFGYDMFFTSGMPLVLSVLSFAVAAAVGSAVWTWWQRHGPGHTEVEAEIVKT